MKVQTLKAAVTRRQNFDWLGYLLAAAAAIELAVPQLVDQLVPGKWKPVAVLVVALLVILLRMYREHLNLNGVNLRPPPPEDPPVGDSVR